MPDLAVSAAVAARGLDVDFSVAGGEVLAVVGPNGAGKSTIAEVIAGLLRADDAVVRVGDRTLTDTGAGVGVPIHRRRVGLLLQDPLLFPNMSVLGNVVFAARHGGTADHAHDRARHWLDRVGMADLGQRRPGELSGGQAQRVALARALAAEPDVLVLDEPLAGLDVAAAASMRTVLRDVVAGPGAPGRPVVLITHDLLDVLGLADRVLVLEAGRITECGRAAGVLSAPRSAFGARMAGVNLVRGVLTGPSTLRSGHQLWHGVPAQPLPPGVDAVAVFSPGAVAVFRDEPKGSPRNSVEVPIADIEVAGGVVRIRALGQSGGLPGLAADLTSEAVADLRLTVGDRVWFSVKTQSVALHGGLRSDSARPPDLPEPV